MIPRIRLIAYAVMFIVTVSAISVPVAGHFSANLQTSGGSTGSASNSDLSLHGLMTAGDSANSASLGGLIPVVFTEKGLPTGAKWWVNVSGDSYFSVNSSIDISLPGGTYSYRVFNALDFFTAASAGNFTLSSKGTVITVTFDGKFSVSGYVDLNTMTQVNSTSQLSANQSVFPVYGLFDNYSGVFLVAGYSDSRIFEIGQYNHSAITSFKTPSSPDAIAYNSETGDIYAVNSTDLFVFNSSGHVLDKIYVGPSLSTVSYDPANNQIMVALLDGSIEAINADILNERVTIHGITALSTQSFAFDSKTGDMLVINDTGENGRIAAIAPNDQIAYEMKSDGILLSIAYDNATNRTFAVGTVNGTSYVYAVSGVSSSAIPGTGLAFGLGYDSYDGLLYVTNSQNRTLWIVNTTTDSIVYSMRDSGKPLIPISSPGAAAFLVINPVEDALDEVTISDAAVNVTFSESGLSTGTTWAVTVNGYSISSSTTEDSFRESPGLYGYSVQPVQGYLGVQSGQVYVGLHSIVINLHFIRAYNVTFTERGLPQGKSWTVLLNNTAYDSQADGNITIPVSNGTYMFEIKKIAGYGDSPSSGLLTVNGSALVVSVSFSADYYYIAFNSTGLPSGTGWSINVNGITETVSGNTMEYQATPGTYNYSIPSLNSFYPTIREGSLAVTTHNVTVNITWLPFLYTVEFKQSSLPHDTVWYLNISGGPELSSISGNLSIGLQNGQHNYTFVSVNRSWKGGEGSFSVNGANETIPLVFTLVTFPVSFMQTSLPPGTEWNVQAGSREVFSSGEFANTSLPNGTFSYDAYSSNISFQESHGNFVVNGSKAIVEVNFTLKEFTISFNEKGLPSNFTWGVDLQGTGTFTSNNSVINVTVPVGTYTFSPLQVAGYNASAGGFVQVSSENVTVQVNYTELPSYTSDYNITIFEMGLPRSFHWGISLNDTTEITYAGWFFNVSLQNGTYNLSVFSINPDGKVMVSQLVFPVVVNGTNQQILVLFYGPYVWMIFDICTAGHYQHDHRGNHKGDTDGIDNVIAATRFRKPFGRT